MRLTACMLAAVGLAAAGAEARPPTAWVTVTGQVIDPLGMPVPGPKMLPGFANVPDESVLVSAKTRGVKNVVVWLRPDDQNAKSKLAPAEVHPDDAKRPPKVVFIDYTARQVFEPRVSTVRVGDTVVARNPSGVATSVTWVSANNGGANVLLPPGQAGKLAGPLVAESSPIHFRAAVVPSEGYVRIFEHPYHAVTDADGRFELKDAPAGKYRLVYWHERVGFKDGKDGRFGKSVEIAPGKDGTMALPPIAFDVTK
jgi:hypothetical protein